MKPGKSKGGRTGRIAYLEERLVAKAWGAIRSDGDTLAVAPHVIRAQDSEEATQSTHWALRSSQEIPVNRLG